MKKTILYLLTITMLAWQGLAAQSVPSGSRLNMSNKKKAASPENLSFAAIPSGLTYKPLSLQSPKALNKFYRTFLFSNTVAPESTGVQEAELVAKNIEKKAIPVESAIKTEEQLYISDAITVSNIYPNPASERAELDYNITGDLRDAKVIFYNVLGTKMNEYVLNKNNRKLTVDTTVMPTGLYFYQLSLEGKKVATKKMLVRHQQ
ncbi:MAG TPA: T9SS type A sorting domain-containing protein [Dyadobacter sp.]|nr:T9SS type A sorting domain-containing protein [Dyadobacter sp.]